MLIVNLAWIIEDGKKRRRTSEFLVCGEHQPVPGGSTKPFSHRSLFSFAFFAVSFFHPESALIYLNRRRIFFGLVVVCSSPQHHSNLLCAYVAVDHRLAIYRR